MTVTVERPNDTVPSPTLTGLRILELDDGVAVSVTGMLLADHGAEVVKVEPPQGSPTRSEAGFTVWNRGKQSVVVDPSKATDCDLLEAAIRGADICILGSTPSSERVGKIEEAIAANKRLIVLRLPAWLDSLTPWAGGRESHGLLAASGGLGMRQSSTDGGPVEPISPYILYIQGLWAATCAVAALIDRGSDGHGQEVTVTGVNALMEAMPHPYSVDPHNPDLPTDIGSYGRHPTYRPYQAADGRWVASGALGPKFERRLLSILGLEALLDDPRIGGDLDRMKLPENLDWVMETVSVAFRQQPAESWSTAMAEAGIPSGVVAGRDELLSHPQIEAIRMRVELNDPEHGTVLMPGVPVTLTESSGRVASAAPVLGSRRLQDLGWSAQPEPQGTPRFGAGPLRGQRVIDMGTFVASPYAGFLMAELGADVIKVEPLAGDPFRASGYPHNRGMRSLSLDLASESGVAAFKRLAGTVDLVLDGMRPGVMSKLGVDHNALVAVKPDIVTVSLSAYGETGPLSQAPGVDMVIQGLSGMMAAQGGSSETPVVATVAYIDVTAAAMCVFGSLLAIVHKERTGTGQHVWTSLLGTSAFLQMDSLTEYDGRSEPVNGDEDFRGVHWLDKYYQATDGWVRLDGQSAQLSARDDVGGDSSAQELQRIVVPSDSTDTQGELEHFIATRTVDQTLAAMRAVGMPAVRARRVSELFNDAELMRSEFAHFRQGTDGSVISTPGRYATFSRTQRWGPMYPPGNGEHSRSVLAEAGLAADEVARLVDDGVVRESEAMPARLAPNYR